ncbi:carboxymuconolactone decarboxylase family protein [Streptomyces luteolifulvus]|jgi:alkylhydroperoxidase family enzyme|uniref:Carboxymuconolactone decarboxylase family protein n=1 Tax=Streptomyces luteolifulvus TaxID=2615112 RepID=A0A6H9URU7_9ACTN|nr:carboxymuconolactone decarboxylase family protein [Streptomyces luteolifulvus]KAB1141019.1 carboxymuconolactone decarboxylase family protein [Streptomyces luteolifulvus]
MTTQDDPRRGDATGAGPRLTPLAEDRWDTRIRHLLALAPRDPGGRVPNIFTTLVRHPDLYERFMPFGAHLLRSGRLPGRVRELLILRTALHTGAIYEWGRHVPLAKAVGLTEAEIERILQGPDADGWAEYERHLLRAADELHFDARLSAATWEALAALHDDADLLEITLLIGQYHMVAFFLNSAGTPLDPGFDPPPFSPAAAGTTGSTATGSTEGT